MGASLSYWNVAQGVKDDLGSLYAEIEEIFSNLEATDDPGELADSLQEIQKRIAKLAAQIPPALKPLRAASKAMGEIPDWKSV